MRNDAERYDWNDPLEARRRLAADRIDADFASLRVWQEANEDGISDAGELKTLAELRRMLSGHPKAKREVCISAGARRGIHVL